MSTYHMSDIQRVLNDSGITINRRDFEIQIDLFLKLRAREELWVETQELNGVTLHITDERGTHHGQPIGLPLFMQECIVLRDAFSVPEHGKYTVYLRVCGGIDEFPKDYAERILQGQPIRKYLKRKSEQGFKSGKEPMFETPDYHFKGK